MTKRLVRLADDLSSHPAKSIPVACAGPAEVKAACRLLDNEGLRRERLAGRTSRYVVLARMGGVGADTALEGFTRKSADLPGVSRAEMNHIASLLNPPPGRRRDSKPRRKSTKRNSSN